jgi:hypothetical protein
VSTTSFGARRGHRGSVSSQVQSGSTGPDKVGRRPEGRRGRDSDVAREPGECQSASGAGVSNLRGRNFELPAGLARGPARRRNKLKTVTVCDFRCVFITAVPNTKLCAWGEEDSGGHVL